MAFAERAVNACVKAMSVGRGDERLIQDILKCKIVNVTPLEVFFGSPSRDIRLKVARIVGEKGNMQVLLDAALKEEDSLILMEMLKILGKRKAEGLEAFGKLLQSDDGMVREVVIQMFRRANKTDQLFPLLFDSDDNVVNRIKRYFDEQERQNR
jgi:hypothetical protein